MVFVPRSVTTSVRPSRLNEICAGSASSALSGRVDSGSGVSFPSAMRKPLIDAVPFERT
jgi:hypothetical protein